MAVVKVMPYTYSWDSDLKNLCDYIVNQEKTGYGYYTFGRGAEPLSAFEDFCELQQLHGKTYGRRAYHIIVSFDPKYAFCAEDGMALAYNISSYFFPSFQVLRGSSVSGGSSCSFCDKYCIFRSKYNLQTSY